MNETEERTFLTYVGWALALLALITIIGNAFLFVFYSFW